MVLGGLKGETSIAEISWREESNFRNENEKNKTE
jgi:hypothetical protein